MTTRIAKVVHCATYTHRMDENEAAIEPHFDPEAVAKRSLTHDVIVAVSGGAALGVVQPIASAIVDKVANPEPKEETPKVILPPGSKSDD